MNQSPAQIRTLADALPKIRWDVERRGALLVVDTDNVIGTYQHRFTASQPRQDPELALEADADGLNLRDVAAHFNRKIVPTGTLTVLASEMIPVLNTHPGKGDLFAGLRPEQKQTLFMASLTPVQWEMYGSPNGLGASDLTVEQRGLFLSILPNPIRYQKLNITHNAQGQETTRYDAPTVTLTPAERAQVRIRLIRKATYMFPTTGADNSYYGTSLESKKDRQKITITQDFGGNHKEVFGVNLINQVPNRLKPSDLNYDAAPFAAEISLAGAKTVQELIQRIATASKIELYADSRLGKLPVYVRGESARASDILKALCYGVGGTFRRLDKATFVLTNDREGLGTRTAAIVQWANSLERATNDQIAKLQEKMATLDPAQYIRFSETDEAAPPASFSEKIDSTYRKEGSNLRLQDMLITDLPAGLQTILQDAAHRMNTSSSQKVRTDAVSLQLRLDAVYILPGVGAAESQFGYTMGNDLSVLFPRPKAPNYVPPPQKPTVPPFPPRLTGRAVMVAPKTGDEVDAILRRIRAAKLNQLWVDLPDDPAEAVKLLATVAEHNKANPIPVYGVVHLLSRRVAPVSASAVSTAKPATANAVPAASSTAPEAESADAIYFDRNIFGQSTTQSARQSLSSMISSDMEWLRKQLRAIHNEWLRFDTPDAQDSIKSRLLTIVRTPGITGIALGDVIPPGYALTNEPNMGRFYAGGSEFGYTPAMRLGFLRKYGADPIDIPSQTYAANTSLDLPYYTENQQQYDYVDGQMVPRTNPDRQLSEKWALFCNTALVSLLNSVYQSVRQEAPNLPVFLSNAGTTWFWVATWEKPFPPPAYAAPTTDYNYRQPSQEAKMIGKTAYLFQNPLFWVDTLSPEKRGSDIRHVVSGILKPWDGFVLDFSTESVEKCLPILDAFAAVPEKEEAEVAKP